MVKPVVRITGLKEATARMDEGAIPRAMRSTLNLLSNKLGQAQLDSIHKSFKRVKKYTENSLFNYGPKPGTPLNKMNTFVGSVSYYLADLEDGLSPQAMAYTTDQYGQRVTKKGRWIPSQKSRNTDGSVRGAYQLKKLSKTFILNVQGQEIVFRRDSSGRLIRVRVLHEDVSAVKPYKWFDKAVSSVYTPEWIEKTFANLLVSGEGWEIARK